MSSVERPQDPLSQSFALLLGGEAKPQPEHGYEHGYEHEDEHEDEDDDDEHEHHLGPTNRTRSSTALAQKLSARR